MELLPKRLGKKYTTKNGRFGKGGNDGVEKKAGNDEWETTGWSKEKFQLNLSYFRYEYPDGRIAVVPKLTMMERSGRRN